MQNLHQWQLAWRENPLTRQLTWQFSRTAWPVMTRRGLGVAFLLGVANYLALHYGQFWVIETSWLVGWVVLLGIPVLVALVASTLTLQDIGGGQYQLLYLTNLSEGRIIWGYVLHTLYRVRGLIIGMMSLTPMLVIGVFYTILRTHYLVGRVSNYAEPTPPSGGQLILPMLAFVVFNVGLWGANVLAAAVGVCVALRFRHLLVTGVVTTVLMIGCMLVLTLGGWLALLVPQALQIIMVMCLPTSYITFFTLLWDGILRMGRHYVRQPE